MNTVGNKSLIWVKSFELRLQGSRESNAGFVPVRTSGRSLLWHDPYLAKFHIKEFWETLTYALLWICGLIGIALSWV